MADEDILNRSEDVKIRTMEGDLGGAPPVGGQAPENLLKPETTVQLPPPEQPVGPAGKLFPEEEPAKKVKIWFWVGGAVLVVALGLVGYFVVYPLVFPPKVVAPAGEEKPVVKTEAAPHKSLFANPPAATSKISFSQLNLLNIASELQAESLKVLAAGSVRELEIADGQGNQIPFAFYLPEIVSSLENLKLAEWFEKDFTAYLYYDANGVWPGYVAKIKYDAKVDELKAALTQLESADLSAFYISSPGTFGKFKDGKVGSFATRYSVGSKLGASFNYGYFGDKLIISTSFNGLKSAVSLLNL